MLCSNRMKRKGFPFCVGVADGTLFPLMEKLIRKDFTDFHGRQHKYSMSTLIVCDDKRNILAHYSSWPGSLHNNRIFQNCDLFRHPNSYFTRGVYLLGDSAYMNTKGMVTSFKLPPGQLNLPADKSYFNRVHSRARVVSEHTIGLLKGRFCMLRGIPLRLKKGRATLLKLVRHIEACVILHNILNCMNETDYETWIRENQQFNIENGLVVHDEAQDALNKDAFDDYQNPNNETRATLLCELTRNPIYLT
jgi:hypothetical protein